jgi:hypothetical protein
MVHHGVTKQPNGTITGGRVSHIGQIYFDQSLLREVEAVAPYSTNKQNWIQNQGDFLFTAGATGDDPIVRYAPIGTSVTQGMMAWIRMGIDASATRRYNPAAMIDEKGGHQLVANPGGMPAGGGGFVFPGMPARPTTG